MPESYEKDGVIYFKEPYRVDAMEWSHSHICCDSLALVRAEYDENVGCGETIYVVCYASEPKYNDRIETLLETMEYPEPLCLERGYVPAGRGIVTLFRVEDKRMRAHYMNGLYYVRANFEALDKMEFETSLEFVFDTGSLYTIISSDIFFTPVMGQVISDLGWDAALEFGSRYIGSVSGGIKSAYKMCFRDVRIGLVTLEKFHCYIVPDANHLAVLGTDFINYCSSISFDRRDIVFDLSFDEYYKSGDAKTLVRTDKFLSKFALHDADVDEDNLASTIIGCYNRQGGYVIPESYEKDGIIHFEKPHRVDSMQWHYDHPFCKSIILKKQDFVDYGSGCMEYVCCYASAPEYNEALKEIYISGMYGDDVEIVIGDTEDHSVMYV